ncbi:hypothetical protein Kpol_264p3 [Vanderwaltozyma polyspora DSM 70294]|uniref:Anoctamin transmembrane domain-containing protein n=1 Tax=Vanderwaltozyma polyspora (strain ATCC 22028 / DSM 70294 / BCRC 21397 / CBS 2163 / NBRC 10782 / NRRL Y-8283 / UCD 57-17) TaxID=436907 RepID=A7TSY6_VANPO|nr:uncharacterized protein Kpol_264p3 [Vanderwaltozyma polyspora DSM 70294]EDO14617.1 hypothetical protein Kpol_264p3 [Vanderwaltozyma polyspora DSM 70294]
MSSSAVHSTLDQLNPNFVIIAEYSSDNVSKILAELSTINLNVVSRPGCNNDYVYIFTKVKFQEQKIALYDLLTKVSFIDSIIPISEFKKTKQLEFSVKKLIKSKHLIPNESELYHLANLVNDKNQIYYFMFFKKYIKWLRNLSLIGLLFRFISSPWEFNFGYSAILSFSSLYFVASWIYHDKSNISKKINLQNHLTLHDNTATMKLSKSVILKKISFIPISFIFILALVSFQFFCFSLEIFITQLYSGGLKPILTLLPTILISVFVPVLTMVYNNFFVNPFVNWENGPNPRRSKMEKNLCLTFFTSYMPLFLTLFVYLPFGYLFNDEVKDTIIVLASKFFIPVVQDDFIVNISRYQKQFYFFIVTNQLVLTSMENLVPIIMKKVIPMIKKTKQNKLSRSEEKKIINSVESSYTEDFNLWNQVRLYQASQWGEFNADENFKKVIVQFGYVSMFSTIWPLAPAVLFIINSIIYRADLWRAFIKCRPSSNVIFEYRNSSDETQNDLLNEEPCLWDIVLPINSIFGSIICMTLTYMYRYCNLPGVGYKLYSRYSDYWYKENPMEHSYLSILLAAIIFEHISIFFYYIFVKIFKAERYNGQTGYIPNSKAKIPKQELDLSNAGEDTKNAMNKIKDNESLKSRTVDNTINFPKSVTTGAEISTSNSSVRSNTVTEKSLPDSKHFRAGPVINTLPESIESLHTGKKSGTHTTPSTTASIPDVLKVSQEGSNVAGATVPEPIPTSKNYFQRYDENGNLLKTSWSAIAGNGSTLNNKENINPILPSEHKSSLVTAPSGLREVVNASNIAEPSVQQPEVAKPLAAAAAAAALAADDSHREPVTPSKVSRNDSRRHSQVNTHSHENRTPKSNGTSATKERHSSSHKRKSTVISKPEKHLRHSTSKEASLNSSKSDSKKSKGFLRKLTKKL